MRARIAHVALGAGLLVTGSLAGGCASPTEDYCSTLKADKARLEKLAATSDKPGTDVLHGSLTVFQQLEDASPQDIHGDWSDFVFAWKNLVEAFDAAGIKPSQFDPAHQPAGMSDAEFKQITEAAAGLRSEPVRLAARRIEDHAQTICKVDLGAGLGGA